jgi:hypothetical protein
MGRRYYMWNLNWEIQMENQEFGNGGEGEKESR